MCQCCGFDPRSRHMQESTNDYIHGWSNKLMFFSLSLKKEKIKVSLSMSFDYNRIKSEISSSSLENPQIFRN